MRAANVRATLSLVEVQSRKTLQTNCDMFGSLVCLWN